jgi:hypothetical protein
MPTFMIFKNGQRVETVQGADSRKLSTIIKKIAAEADSDGAEGGFAEGSGSGGPTWLGAKLPRGYKDITDQIDIRGLDLSNADPEFGVARVLFAPTKPVTLVDGKSKEDEGAKKDWVESDTDEQLMLFIPFQSTLKIHTLHITSFSGQETTAGRPKTIHLYTNRAHTLGFDEADDIPPTQVIELSPESWNDETGTASIELRFVKFQNVTSLVIFVVDAEDDKDRTTIDRIRLVGETGEKRDMGKLEKFGDSAE